MNAPAPERPFTARRAAARASRRTMGCDEYLALDNETRRVLEDTATLDSLDDVPELLRSSYRHCTPVNLFHPEA